MVYPRSVEISDDSMNTHSEDKKKNSQEVMLSLLSEAEALKDLGNVAYRSCDFNKAIEFFTQALAIDSANHKYLTNRSLAYSSIGEWTKSAQDAKAAVAVSPKYEKANFRLVKALIELGRYREARVSLLSGLRECGETKDLKVLEELIFTRTHIALRPKSSDFEILEELGDGNFSKVYKARHKVTKRDFAVKAIERMTVDRMKRRHPNINNEILMEKRALYKLDHPGVVVLFATLQDYGTLYYQMEFVAGRDLWSLMQESSPQDATQTQVGCHWSQARFFFAEALSAVEHMHRCGVVHRDIKPENMMITADGHLKFVDFGTAKDLVQTDLNGPEFVGTAEYMAPSTVNNQAAGPEVDLWALGCVLVQMMLGYTPFSAASPYLIFLRIKRAHLRVPDWVPRPVASLMRLLLVKDAPTRMANATGAGKRLANQEFTVGELQSLSYDALRVHSFFSEWHSVDTEDGVRALLAAGAALPAKFLSAALQEPSQNDTAMVAAESLQIDPLNTVEGVRSVYQRPALVTAPVHEQYIRALGRACLAVAEATADNGGVRPEAVPWMQSFDLLALSESHRHRIAHYLNRRGRLHSPGVFRLFFSSAVDARTLRADPSTREFVGFSRAIQGHWNKDFVYAHISNPAVAVGAAGEKGSLTRLRDAVAGINKLRPKFVVVSGDMTVDAVGHGSHATQADEFRLAIARMSDTIPLLFVPGPLDVGHVPTEQSLAEYRRRFGADFYGAWFGGLRCLVLNSSLMANPQGAPEAAALQDLWLTEEIEQMKLCSTSAAIFMHHAWFINSLDEADAETTTIPSGPRQKWLKKLRHHKVKLCVSAHFGGPASESSKKLRPFVAVPRRRDSVDSDTEEGRAHAGLKTPHMALSDEPLLPSQVISAAVASGELSLADTQATDCAHGEAEGHRDHSGSAVVGVDEVDVSLSADRDSRSDTENQAHQINEQGDEAEDFPNEEEDYAGPELLQTLPVGGIARSGDESTQGGGVREGGVRFILVKEDAVTHVFCPIGGMPSSGSDLMQLFR